MVVNAIRKTENQMSGKLCSKFNIDVSMLWRVISEVLNLTPNDVDERKLILQKPKSGRRGEVAYIPSKLQRRLNDYIRDHEIQPDEKLIPISYSSSWSLVRKAGKLVGINVRPHDLRRHAGTYASKAGTPLEIVSKVILRHAELVTTQRYFGNVSDIEAIRWIENLYGETNRRPVLVRP